MLDTQNEIAGLVGYRRVVDCVAVLHELRGHDTPITFHSFLCIRRDIRSALDYRLGQGGGGGKGGSRGGSLELSENRA
jgi:hypothetical protein